MLGSRKEHQFDVHVPGYDLRRCIQAKDPLCCSSHSSCKYARSSPPSQASECARIAFIVWNTMIHAKTLLEAVQSWRVALLAEPKLSSEQLRHRKQMAVSTSTSSWLFSAYISTSRCKNIAELIQKGFAAVGEFKKCMTNIHSESFLP